MSTKDYETESDPLTEKNGDYNLELQCSRKRRSNGCILYMGR